MTPDTRHLHSALDSGTQHSTVALGPRQWHSALGSGTRPSAVALDVTFSFGWLRPTSRSAKRTLRPRKLPGRVPLLSRLARSAVLAGIPKWRRKFNAVFEPVADCICRISGGTTAFSTAEGAGSQREDSACFPSSAFLRDLCGELPYGGSATP